MARLLPALLVLLLPWASGDGVGAKSPEEELEATTPEFEAMKWFPTSGERGAYRLKLEAGVDPVVREYLAAHGEPELARVRSARRLKLIYLERDELVVFSRGTGGAGTALEVLYPIPGRVLTRLPAEARASVREARRQAIAAGRDSIATCFAARPDGKLLTANHVVEAVSSVRVRLADGRRFDAEVEARAPDQDIALLRIPARELTYLPLAEPGAIRLGLRVFTIGFPALRILGPGPKYSEGVVSALRGSPEEDETLLVSIPSHPGNSGGPLVTETGEVVGIMLGTANHLNFLETTGSLPQNVTWATRIASAADLFQAPPRPPAARSREEAIERARAAVCLVEAHPG